ncbi:uncharacterized protein [Antedon mediterranea]|uniref:uncharacterized protein isoform X4 n=1 Tax=Antedon mediterranea TaxID=105859 RepID=UPI003AF6DF71
MATSGLELRVQYLDDTDPFASTIFPEPTRPPCYDFNEYIPLIDQIGGIHRLLNAPHKLEDSTLQLSHNGLYLDLESSIDEQRDDFEGFQKSEGRKNSILLRTQLSVRVHACIEKLLNCTGRELRRALFSLKQIFQDDKDLVHEFVSADGLACLIKVGAEADQNYQNYILRALGQVMLYVDGMNGVIEHNETIQWLYSLIISKFRLVVKTSLKLLLVFIEYTESNVQLLLQAIKIVDKQQGQLAWCNLATLIKDDSQDSEVLIYAMTLVNKTLNGIPNQDTFYDITDALEEQNIEAVSQKFMKRRGADLDLLEQFRLYEMSLKQEDGDSDIPIEQHRNMRKNRRSADPQMNGKMPRKSKRSSLQPTIQYSLDTSLNEATEQSPTIQTETTENSTKMTPYRRRRERRRKGSEEPPVNESGVTSSTSPIGTSPTCSPSEESLSERRQRIRRRAQQKQEELEARSTSSIDVFEFLSLGDMSPESKHDQCKWSSSSDKSSPIALNTCTNTALHVSCNKHVNNKHHDQSKKMSQYLTSEIVENGSEIQINNPENEIKECNKGDIENDEDTCKTDLNDVKGNYSNTGHINKHFKSELAVHNETNENRQSSYLRPDNECRDDTLENDQCNKKHCSIEDKEKTTSKITNVDRRLQADMIDFEDDTVLRLADEIIELDRTEVAVNETIKPKPSLSTQFEADRAQFNLHKENNNSQLCCNGTIKIMDNESAQLKEDDRKNFVRIEDFEKVKFGPVRNTNVDINTAEKSKLKDEITSNACLNSPEAKCKNCPEACIEDDEQSSQESKSDIDKVVTEQQLQAICIEKCYGDDWNGKSNERKSNRSSGDFSLDYFEDSLSYPVISLTEPPNTLIPYVEYCPSVGDTSDEYLSCEDDEANTLERDLVLDVNLQSDNESEEELSQILNNNSSFKHKKSLDHDEVENDVIRITDDFNDQKKTVLIEDKYVQNEGKIIKGCIEKRKYLNDKLILCDSDSGVGDEDSGVPVNESEDNQGLIVVHKDISECVYDGVYSRRAGNILENRNVEVCKVLGQEVNNISIDKNKLAFETQPELEKPEAIPKSMHSFDVDKKNINNHVGNVSVDTGDSYPNRNSSGQNGYMQIIKDEDISYSESKTNDKIGVDNFCCGSCITGGKTTVVKPQSKGKSHQIQKENNQQLQVPCQELGSSCYVGLFQGKSPALPHVENSNLIGNSVLDNTFLDKSERILPQTNGTNSCNETTDTNVEHGLVCLSSDAKHINVEDGLKPTCTSLCMPHTLMTNDEVVNKKDENQIIYSDDINMRLIPIDETFDNHNSILENKVPNKIDENDTENLDLQGRQDNESTNFKNVPTHLSLERGSNIDEKQCNNTIGNSTKEEDIEVHLDDEIDSSENVDIEYVCEQLCNIEVKPKNNVNESKDTNTDENTNNLHPFNQELKDKNDGPLDSENVVIAAHNDCFSSTSSQIECNMEGQPIEIEISQISTESDLIGNDILQCLTKEVAIKMSTSDCNYKEMNKIVHNDQMLSIEDEIIVLQDSNLREEPASEKQRIGLEYDVPGTPVQVNKEKVVEHEDTHDFNNFYVKETEQNVSTSLNDESKSDKCNNLLLHERQTKKRTHKKSPEPSLFQVAEKVSHDQRNAIMDDVQDILLLLSMGDSSFGSTEEKDEETYINSPDDTIIKENSQDDDNDDERTEMDVGYDQFDTDIEDEIDTDRKEDNTGEIYIDENPLKNKTSIVTDSSTSATGSIHFDESIHTISNKSICIDEPVTLKTNQHKENIRSGKSNEEEDSIGFSDTDVNFTEINVCKKLVDSFENEICLPECTPKCVSFTEKQGNNEALMNQLQNTALSNCGENKIIPPVDKTNIISSSNYLGNDCTDPNIYYKRRRDNLNGKRWDEDDEILKLLTSGVSQPEHTEKEMSCMSLNRRWNHKIEENSDKKELENSKKECEKSVDEIITYDSLPDVSPKPKEKKVLAKPKRWKKQIEEEVLTVKAIKIKKAKQKCERTDDDLLKMLKGGAITDQMRLAEKQSKKRKERRIKEQKEEEDALNFLKGGIADFVIEEENSSNENTECSEIIVDANTKKALKKEHLINKDTLEISIDTAFKGMSKTEEEKMLAMLSVRSNSDKKKKTEDDNLLLLLSEGIEDVDLFDDFQDTQVDVSELSYYKGLEEHTDVKEAENDADSIDEELSDEEYKHLPADEGSLLLMLSTGAISEKEQLAQKVAYAKKREKEEQNDLLLLLSNGTQHLELDMSTFHEKQEEHIASDKYNDNYFDSENSNSEVVYVTDHTISHESQNHVGASPKSISIVSDEDEILALLKCSNKLVFESDTKGVPHQSPVVPQKTISTSELKETCSNEGNKANVEMLNPIEETCTVIMSKTNCNSDSLELDTQINKKSTQLRMIPMEKSVQSNSDTIGKDKILSTSTMVKEDEAKSEDKLCKQASSSFPVETYKTISDEDAEALFSLLKSGDEPTKNIMASSGVTHAHNSPVENMKIAHSTVTNTEHQDQDCMLRNIDEIKQDKPKVTGSSITSENTWWPDSAESPQCSPYKTFPPSDKLYNNWWSMHHTTKSHATIQEEPELSSKETKTAINVASEATTPSYIAVSVTSEKAKAVVPRYRSRQRIQDNADDIMKLLMEGDSTLDCSNTDLTSCNDMSKDDNTIKKSLTEYPSRPVDKSTTQSSVVGKKKTTADDEEDILKLLTKGDSSPKTMISTHTEELVPYFSRKWKPRFATSTQLVSDTEIGNGEETTKVEGEQVDEGYDTLPKQTNGEISTPEPNRLAVPLSISTTSLTAISPRRSRRMEEIETSTTEAKPVRRRRRRQDGGDSTDLSTRSESQPDPVVQQLPDPEVQTVEAFLASRKLLAPDTLPNGIASRRRRSKQEIDEASEKERRTENYNEKEECSLSNCSSLSSLNKEAGDRSSCASSISIESTGSNEKVHLPMVQKLASSPTETAFHPLVQSLKTSQTQDAMQEQIQTSPTSDSLKAINGPHIPSSAGLSDMKPHTPSSAGLSDTKRYILDMTYKPDDLPTASPSSHSRKISTCLHNSPSIITRMESLNSPSTLLLPQKDILNNFGKVQSVQDKLQLQSSPEGTVAEESSRRGDVSGAISQAIQDLSRTNPPGSISEEESIPNPHEERKKEWEKILHMNKRELRIMNWDFTDLNTEDDDDILDYLTPMYFLNGVPPPPPVSGAPMFMPPPPPIVNSHNSTLKRTPDEINKKKKTVRLHWKEANLEHPVFSSIKEGSQTGTIWETLSSVKLDCDKLEHLFENRTKELSIKKSDSVKKNVLTVLDHKRSNGINIGLTVLPQPRTIKQAILNMDSISINKEGVEKLLTLVPSDEEIKLIQDAMANHPDVPLGSAEQFLMTMSSISGLKARLNLWLFKMDYETLEQEVAEPLADLKQGIEDLKSSKTLKYILATLLAIGNFLNGVQAKGFNLEYLARVPEVKDTVHKQSLLHHLCSMVIEKFPDSSDLYSELASISRCSKVDFEVLAVTLERMEIQCKQSWEHLRVISKHDSHSQLKNKLQEFLADSAQRIIVLKIVHRRVLNRFNKLLLYCGFNPNSASDIKVNEFCKVLSEFALEYRTARERVQEQEKKKENHRKRNKTRGKMIVEKFTGKDKEEDAKLQKLLKGSGTTPGDDATRKARAKKPQSRNSMPGNEESTEEQGDEMMDILVKSATAPSNRAPRKRTRHGNRKSLRRTLKGGLSEEEAKALGFVAKPETLKV